MKRMIVHIAALVLAVMMLVSAASALTVNEAADLLEEHYVGNLPENLRECKNLDELFALVGDPYTYYMSGEDYQAFLNGLESPAGVVGIGVSIQYTEQGILITDALKGSPAAKAGLKTGDLIVSIDEVPCVPANETHRDFIIGPEGTSVTVTVLREGVALKYTLTRAFVSLPNTVTSLVKEHIGYIDCDSFGSETAAFVKNGISEYEDRVDCWLVDLRSNTGGITDAATETLSYFGGPAFYLYLQDGSGILYVNAGLGEKMTDKPVVVLVNRYTASAAEAFASGIRDLNRGVIVGSRTYGKGVAQIILDDERHPDLFAGDALKMTAYRFFSFAGNTNDKMGVIPTLLVSESCAKEIGIALCGDLEDESENTLRLWFGNQLMSVNLAELSAEGCAEFLAALPPSAELYLSNGIGGWVKVTVEQVARQIGVSYHSRWFNDVNGSAYKNEINTLGTYGILDGKGGGKFDPSGALTRAEACAMLARALNLPLSNGTRFADVDAAAWYASYVNAMADVGFVNGVGNGKFAPNAVMSAQEYDTMIGRVAAFLSANISYAIEELTEDDLAAMNDLGYADWAQENAALLSHFGLLPAGKVSAPTAPVNRETAAAELYELLTKTGILAV